MVGGRRSAVHNVRVHPDPTSRPHLPTPPPRAPTSRAPPDFADQEKRANEVLSRLKKRRDKFGGPGDEGELLLNGRDTWGRTAMHWAAATGLDLVDLSRLKEEVAAAQARATRVRAQAAEQGEAAAANPTAPGADHERWAWLVQQLVDRDAAVNICDVDGRTPLDLAVSAGNVAAVRVLLDAGASMDSDNRWGKSADDIARLRTGTVGAEDEEEAAGGEGEGLDGGDDAAAEVQAADEGEEEGEGEGAEEAVVAEVEAKEEVEVEVDPALFEGYDDGDVDLLRSLNLTVPTKPAEVDEAGDAELLKWASTVG